jgi:hypothetical protein
MSRSSSSSTPTDTFSLLCCPSAIPSTFKHLASLISSSTTHNPLQKPHTSAALLTSFLAYLSASFTRKLPVFSRPLPRFWTPHTIIQVIKVNPSATSPSYEKERYFSPVHEVGNGLEKKEKVLGNRYKELDKAEAESALRFPGSDIVIGDGENWEQFEGMEKLWCEPHQVWWEFKVWIRTS